MSGISTARLIQTMGETQMRVGMHSSEFGDISIRTVVSQQQMQAQISVDHSELGNALSAHIPSLQTKLGSEYGLHATIEVNQSGASFSNGGERSSQNQQQTVARSLQGAEAPAAIQNDILSPRISAETSGEYRLDIRA
jgi:flagellar hook-length control protein FliK